MTHTDGGPAFPMAGYTEMVEGKPNTLYAPMNGMSLRDYFAAAALTSMLSPVQQLTDETPARAAELSYQMADAMLARRSKP